MVALIEHILDFFYRPFSRFMDRLTFRYAACGGGNTVLDIFLFFIIYNFILQKQMLHLPFITISPHIASFILSFFITFPIGFLLMRYVVFKGSRIRGRIQLFRYFLTVLISIFLNYICLKLFVEKFHIFPTIAKILTTVVAVTFSYLSQRHFTFKMNPASK